MGFSAKSATMPIATMPDDTIYDFIIIGAGIVGLATALRLQEAAPERRIVVVDKEQELATHQTGHNSGVIHSGIYYRPGSLRARNCLQGYRELLAFCEKHELPHDICGKVIVATREAELPQLAKIMDHGQRNGLQGLQLLGREACREVEPHVDALRAIWVPQSGIVDYAAVAKTYARLLQEHGQQMAPGFEVQEIDVRAQEVIVRSTDTELRGRKLINCAGLYADRVARMTGMSTEDFRILPFRGEYYELKPERQHLVRNLIYPVPNPDFPFLGVHYTRMINGGIEAGPNAVLAFRREGYSRWDIHFRELWGTLSYPGFQRLALRHWRQGLDELYRSYSKAAFVSALQHLIPEVQPRDLQRGGSGVRAMACRPDGSLIDDFLIQRSDRVVNVCSAPSPAATASLAIGQEIARIATQE